MGKYLLKRLGQSIIAILGITVVVFFILHLTGNPVELMVSPTTSKEEMEILSEEMGFNDPLPVQYVRFLKGALVGDFGTSYYYNEPAMSVVLERAPATLTLACAALLISVVLGSNLIEVLGKEYIDVAKAKGLPKSKIIGKHALKNAMSSIITILGMQFASLLGGSVITEQVFAWPGVGRLVIQSITTSDFAVVECIVFLMAVIFVVINFIVDVLYCVINPRVRLQ